MKECGKMCQFEDQKSGNKNNNNVGGNGRNSPEHLRDRDRHTTASTRSLDLDEESIVEVGENFNIYSIMDQHNTGTNTTGIVDGPIPIPKSRSRLTSTPKNDILYLESENCRTKSRNSHGKTTDLQQKNDSSISSISNSIAYSNISSPNWSPSSGFSSNTNSSANCNNNNNNNNIFNTSNEDSVGESNSLQEQYLPICDALFNVLSLAAYFCDIVFSVLSAYLLCTQELYVWGIVALVFISFSIILSQILSLKWYRAEAKKPDGQPYPFSGKILTLIHLCLSGVLWRYFKLFIPLDLRFIKTEVRDLCLLRLVHGLCEAAPMLLLQLYLIWSKPSYDEVDDLLIVSSALSLFNICWALASYSKNIRRQNVHKLVLTWLGVIFQFLWRLGTITARIVALSIYATAYGPWLFLVIILHWFSMLMWLISPKNAFQGEKMSISKKIGYSALIAIVYIFCYINVEESPSRNKVFVFYLTMLLENFLLLGVWLIASRFEYPWYTSICVTLVFASFFIGIAFMGLYYRFFHVKRLSYAYETGTVSTTRGSSSLMNGFHNGGGGSKIIPNLNGDFKITNIPVPKPRTTKCLTENGHLINSNGFPSKKPNGHLHNGHGTTTNTAGDQGLYNKMNGHHIHHPNIPGVFNCRFNPAIKRKKKKPTSFVPPPPNGLHNVQNNPHQDKKRKQNCTGQGPAEFLKMSTPFWKRPLSFAASENDGSVNSSNRLDIHQKLEAKKKKQLKDLRQIEEEIKSGKISDCPKLLLENGNGVCSRSQSNEIPCEKKQPWFNVPPSIIMPNSVDDLDGNNDELLLDPSYLMYNPSTIDDNIGDFYEEPDHWNYYEPVFQSQINSTSCKNPANNQNNLNCIYKSHRMMPNDLDQISLPRSYTLPREFKFKRKPRKTVKTDQFLPSANSSDGDVSGEDDPEIYSHLNPFPLPLPSVHHIHTPPGKKSGNSREHRQSRQRLQIETKL